LRTNKEHDPAVIPDMARVAPSNDDTYGDPRTPTQEQMEAMYREAYVDA
jgi:alcohol dehydrogenase class IV